MKNVLSFLRLSVLPVLLLLGLSAVAAAQDARLQIDFLNKLEERASETVDVSVEGPLLQVAKQFLKADKDPETKQISEMIDGLKGIYVKSYEFEKSGEFTEADVNQIREQLRSPNWSKMVNVRSKKEGENVDVYTLLHGEKIDGMAIIVNDPKTLTVVNIVGFVDMAKLAALSGKMGIPNMSIDFGAAVKAAKEK